MKAPAHLSASYRTLWEMEYKFYHETCGETPEEAMEKANQKIQNTERILNAERNQSWVDLTTGKKVKFQVQP